MGIEEGLLQVRENIASAARLSGRAYEDIRLVAVSKFKPCEDIMAAYALGVRDFGENYIQEFCGKEEALPKDILWHVIGPVQRNKVKYIVGKNAIVQTVDRLSLAQELGKYAVKRDVVIPVLLQVNTCGEETKSGCEPCELLKLCEDCLGIEGIRVKGVMTIGPNTDDMLEVEKCFEETNELFQRVKAVATEADLLSMGMTNDYMLAIKHGANIVRVGRAIFGDR